MTLSVRQNRALKISIFYKTTIRVELFNNSKLLIYAQLRSVRMLLRRRKILFIFWFFFLEFRLTNVRSSSLLAENQR